MTTKVTPHNKFSLLFSPQDLTLCFLMQRETGWLQEIKTQNTIITIVGRLPKHNGEWKHGSECIGVHPERTELLGFVQYTAEKVSGLVYGNKGDTHLFTNWTLSVHSFKRSGEFINFKTNLWTGHERLDLLILLHVYGELGDFTALQKGHPVIFYPKLPIPVKSLLHEDIYLGFVGEWSLLVKSGRFKAYEHGLNYILQSLVHLEPQQYVFPLKIIQLCCWLRGFMKSHHLSFRRTTHVVQKKRGSVEWQNAALPAFCNNTEKRRDYPLSHIGTMDETPIWLDMPGDYTLGEIGNKNSNNCIYWTWKKYFDFDFTRVHIQDYIKNCGKRPPVYVQYLLHSRKPAFVLKLEGMGFLKGTTWQTSGARRRMTICFSRASVTPAKKPFIRSTIYGVPLRGVPLYYDSILLLCGWRFWLL